MTFIGSVFDASCDTCGMSWSGSGACTNLRRAAQRHAEREGHRVRVERVQVYAYEHTPRAIADRDRRQS